MSTHEESRAQLSLQASITTTKTNEKDFSALVDYLIHNEFARTLEDIIWRRSKLILHISQTTQDRIARYLGKTV